MIKSSENVASNIESKERIIYCVQDEFQQPLSLPRHVVQDVNMKDTIRTTLMREVQAKNGGTYLFYTVPIMTDYLQHLIE